MSTEMNTDSTISLSEHIVHPEIRALSAYQTEPFTGSIKLDAMESPYGFEGDLQEQLMKKLSSVDINRYPDARNSELTEHLRSVFEIPANYGLTLGNGSDELLQLIQLAVGGRGRSIATPLPTFSLYELVARYTGADFIGVDLNQRFELSESAWFDAIRKHSPACVFFAYPNNPTGNFFSSELIEATAREVKGLVVVDEAYHAYSGQSMLPAMARHENMAVVRTLSKSGLAGLRIGFMISHKQWAAQFEKLRMPYNIGVLNQACAVFALENWSYLRTGVQRVIQERSRVRARLEQLHGIQVCDTKTNFLIARITNQDAEAVFEALRTSGILVRKLQGMHSLLQGCLRISIGTPSENDAMIETLKQIMTGEDSSVSEEVISY